jgi:hypothetical protein
MERMKRDLLKEFKKQLKADNILDVFLVNSSGVDDDMITHEPSVTAFGSIMNTASVTQRSKGSFNSGSSGSLQTGGGE